jgi:hypothetical protein
MADTEKLRERLETMLKEHLGVGELVTDAEGDYPVRAGSAKYYVRLGGEDPPVVYVYAQILVGVAVSAKLYETLNAVNSHIKFGRMFHQDETVFVATELLAESLDLEELGQSCRSIADLADHYDDLFKLTFGGRRQVDNDAGEPENAVAATA